MSSSDNIIGIVKEQKKEKAKWGRVIRTDFRDHFLNISILSLGQQSNSWSGPAAPFPSARGSKPSMYPELCLSPWWLPSSCSGWNDLLGTQGEFPWPRTQAQCQGFRPRLSLHPGRALTAWTGPRELPPLPSLLAQHEQILWPQTHPNGISL